MTPAHRKGVSSSLIGPANKGKEMRDAYVNWRRFPDESPQRLNNCFAIWYMHEIDDFVKRQAVYDGRQWYAYRKDISMVNVKKLIFIEWPEETREDTNWLMKEVEE